LTIHNMRDESLISAYLNAVSLNIEEDFLRLLYKEIEKRDIKHLLPNERYK
jgi:ribosomal protein L12E/L44/L45/RPP1/RPP2